MASGKLEQFLNRVTTRWKNVQTLQVFCIIYSIARSLSHLQLQPLSVTAFFPSILKPVFWMFKNVSLKPVPSSLLCLSKFYQSMLPLLSQAPVHHPVHVYPIPHQSYKIIFPKVTKNFRLLNPGEDTAFNLLDLPKNLLSSWKLFSWLSWHNVLLVLHSLR